jgi:hypothetical protein
MVTNRAVADEVQNLIDYLLAKQIAIFANPVARGFERVTWHSTSAKASDFFQKRQCVDAYRAWVDGGHYSAILFDGAIIQISFDFAAGELSGHRLAYIPCPYEIDHELLTVEPIGDLIDLYSDNGESVLLHSQVRFDFDPMNAAPGHAASHMTMNSADCRVPCLAPLRLGHFVSFVFQHFYPTLWQAHGYLRSLSRKEWGYETLTKTEGSDIHLAWTRAA